MIEDDDLERRTDGPGRREEDGIRERAIVAIHGSGLFKQYKRLVQVALCAWAVIGTVGCISLAVALNHADSVNANATQADVRAARAAGRAAQATSTANRALRGLRQQVSQGCIRLNILRAETNLSSYGDFNVDRTVLVFSLIAKNTTPAAAKFERAFLPKLRFAVAVKRWTPLTDCGHAVNAHSVYYRAPTPIRFSSRLPPSSALDLANAGRSTPLDSVP